MKIVIAIIKPFKLDEVREALVGAGIEGVTASEVRGFGRQKGQTEIYRGAEYEVNFLQRFDLRSFLPTKRWMLACEAIRSAANTEKIGDGKIFVLPVESAIVSVRVKLMRQLFNRLR